MFTLQTQITSLLGKPHWSQCCDSFSDISCIWILEYVTTLYTWASEVNTVSFLPNGMVSKHRPVNSISLSFLQEASAAMRDSQVEKKSHSSWKTWRFGEFWINLTGKDEGFSEIREGYKFLSKLASQSIIPATPIKQAVTQWSSAQATVGVCSSSAAD